MCRAGDEARYVLAARCARGNRRLAAGNEISSTWQGAPALQLHSYFAALTDGITVERVVLVRLRTASRLSTCRPVAHGRWRVAKPAASRW